MNFGIYGLGPPEGLAPPMIQSQFTIAAIAKIQTLGASISTNSIIAGDAMMRQFEGFTGLSKMVFYLPYLGDGILSARVPWIDSLSKGPCINTSFVDADYTETMGLDNRAGSTKRFDTQITPFGCAGTGNFGVGWYERRFTSSAAGVEPIGCYNTGNTTRFGMDLRTTIEHFNAGAPANNCGTAVSAGNKHYYAQRSSATLRAFFIDGVPAGTNNTTSDAATGSNDRSIWVMGNNQVPAQHWNGCSGCAYLTSGDLTIQEVADLHAIVRNYLILPFGR